MSGPLLSATRALFAAYALLTAVYALLAYDPFTFTQVIKFELFGPLTTFARWHAFLYWPAQACALASVWPALRDRACRGRPAALAYAGAALLAGAPLLRWPLLPGLQSEQKSLVIALAALAPIAWLTAIDLWLSLPSLAERPAPPDPARRLVRSAVWAGALVFALFAALAVARGERPSAALLYSLTLELLAGGLVASALLLATAARSVRAQLLLSALGLAAVLDVSVRRALLAISFPPSTAPLVALLLALVLAAALAGLALRAAQASASAAPRSGPELLLAPLALPGGWPQPVRVLAPLAACATFAWVSTSFDWNFLLQQGAVLAAWVLALAALLTGARAGAEPPAAFRWLLAPGALGALLAIAASALSSRPGLPDALRVATAKDPSLRVFAAGAGGADRSSGRASFYETLGRHTNLPPERDVRPFEVELTGARLARTEGHKPNVFVIVIDSLRRDYLPPYEPRAASFAPGVAAFAKDAVVFKNAFTRYGATGLSEPSIWVGGMMPHKQYVTPFAPQDSLAKLLTAEQFVPFVSVDAILEAVVPPLPDLVRLDARVANKDYSLCRTLEELRSKLGAVGRDRPIFFYSQSQDLHVSRIAREGPEVPPGASYPGFHAPVASRIQRWDACFGDFLRDLDRRGLADDSVVILTADHGDSLGEEGRFGHAYTLYPEIVRVPMLVRLPLAWRARARCDPNALAFSADLTPTLFALLGHPVVEKFPWGAPLCALDRDPPARHAGPQLLASSYGPVYGLLEQGGAQLFIADGVNLAEDAFSLGDGPPIRLTPSDEEKADLERQILAGIAQVESAYGLKPEP